MIQEKKKITFWTLKAYARKWKLGWIIKMEFSGMSDGMESIKDPKEIQFTPEKLEEIKATKNYIRENENWTVRVSNCIYSIDFILYN